MANTYTMSVNGDPSGMRTPTPSEEVEKMQADLKAYKGMRMALQGLDSGYAYEIYEELKERFDTSISSYGYRAVYTGGYQYTDHEHRKLEAALNYITELKTEKADMAELMDLRTKVKDLEEQRDYYKSEVERAIKYTGYCPYALYGDEAKHIIMGMPKTPEETDNEQVE